MEPCLLCLQLLWLLLIRSWELLKDIQQKGHLKCLQRLQGIRMCSLCTVCCMLNSLSGGKRAAELILTEEIRMILCWGTFLDYKISTSQS